MTNSLNKIIIESRRKKNLTLEQNYPTSIQIDVTSKGTFPWVKFSPFYPHGNIPIPFSSGQLAQSVEGIWQGLKVFKSCDIDVSKFNITSMKGIKRTVRKNGKVLGHRKGINGKVLLDYETARIQIYLPCYKFVLENYLKKEIDEIKIIARKSDVILLDYESNCDIFNLSRPLSHASLIKRYIENEWPIV